MLFSQEKQEFVLLYPKKKQTAKEQARRKVFALLKVVNAEKFEKVHFIQYFRSVRFFP